MVLNDCKDGKICIGNDVTAWACCKAQAGILCYLFESKQQLCNLLSWAARLLLVRLIQQQTSLIGHYIEIEVAPCRWPQIAAF
jgi:hypothetical protein